MPEAAVTSDRDETSRAEHVVPPAGLLAPLRPYVKSLAIGVVLLVATNALGQTVPWLLRAAVDHLRAGRIREVLPYAAWMVGIAIVGAFVRTGSRVFVFDVGRFVEMDVRMALLRHVQRLGPAFFRRMPTGEIMSRAVNDLGQLRLLYGFGALNIVNSVIAYGSSLTMMFLISPKLTGFALVPYPFYIAITQLFSRWVFKHSRQAQDALGRVSDVAQQSIAGIRVVRSLSLEDAEQRRFGVANDDARDKNLRLALMRGVMFPVLGSIGGIGTLIVVWLGGRMVIDGELTLGQFVAFNAFQAMLVWPTLALGFVLSVVQRGRASYARVRELLDVAPDVVDRPGARDAPIEGALRVDGLSFSHRLADGTERKVLDDVSFEVPARTSVAIVGPVGSGKSTLGALLARILPTPDGSVFVDDVDVNDIRIRALRRTVVFAQQDPFLFSTTVARNIGFALDDTDSAEALARIAHAAREAQVADEIEGLPDGYDTVVGERGVQLSGGQKQRIALARALLVGPRVLVLDDPLSAVDARTESRILDALDRAAEGRTLVLVTNRVAAAKRADHVVVLDAGRVVARGTHAELVAQPGVYASIAARQAAETEIEAL
ncbi:MAG: ABC transporter ATP-binding protein [Deltaproteobacteria bacterium]|nr:ABC transporter ATP-binding protein [Deltaproteobacteria bacterium]